MLHNTFEQNCLLSPWVGLNKALGWINKLPAVSACVQAVVLLSATAMGARLPAQACACFFVKHILTRSQPPPRQVCWEEFNSFNCFVITCLIVFNICYLLCNIFKKTVLFKTRVGNMLILFVYIVIKNKKHTHFEIAL